jgi:hypothetical protein
MANPVVHWEVSGKDQKKLQEFYAALFDWKVEVHEEMDGYGLVEGQEGGIGGGISGTQPGASPSVTFFVQVDDLQASLDKAESLGGKTVMPPTQIPGIGSFAMFQDLEDNAIGLFNG